MDNDNEPPIDMSNMELHPDFGDAESLLNSRQWLESAIVAKGAKITGGGVGMGQADLSFTLEGCAFSVSLKPLIHQ